MKRLWARCWYVWGLMQRFYGLRSGQRAYFQAAQSSFDRALGYNPRLDAALFSRAVMHWRELQAPAQAIIDFTALLEQSSTYSEARFLRGMAHQALGDYRAAVEDLETFIATNPHSRWVGNASRQLANIRAILEELPALLRAGNQV